MRRLHIPVDLCVVVQSYSRLSVVVATDGDLPLVWLAWERRNTVLNISTREEREAAHCKWRDEQLIHERSKVVEPNILSSHSYFCCRCASSSSSVVSIFSPLNEFQVQLPCTVLYCSWRGDKVVAQVSGPSERRSARAGIAITSSALTVNGHFAVSEPVLFLGVTWSEGHKCSKTVLILFVPSIN
jgi:hypothetical protein